MTKLWTFGEWHNVTWHISCCQGTFLSFFFFFTPFSFKNKKSRKGSRWDKNVSSGHVLKSGITLGVWWCSQNTWSSLQHLIKGLLIFSWWSQPSKHLAACTPLFLHHTALSTNTQAAFKQPNSSAEPPVPNEPGKFPSNVLVPNQCKKVLRIGKNEENITSIKIFQTVSGLLCPALEKPDSQVQICGKNAPPHPCRELQLTLHLPTTEEHSSPPVTEEWTQTWQPGTVLGHWSCQEDRTVHRQAREQTESRNRRAGEVKREERRKQSSRETLSLWSSGCFSSSQTSSHHL